MDEILRKRRGEVEDKETLRPNLPLPERPTSASVLKSHPEGKRIGLRDFLPIGHDNANSGLNHRGTLVESKSIMPHYRPSSASSSRVPLHHSLRLSLSRSPSCMQSVRETPRPGFGISHNREAPLFRVLQGNNMGPRNQRTRNVVGKTNRSCRLVSLPTFDGGIYDSTFSSGMSSEMARDMSSDGANAALHGRKHDKKLRAAWKNYIRPTPPLEPLIVKQQKLDFSRKFPFENSFGKPRPMSAQGFRSRQVSLFADSAKQVRPAFIMQHQSLFYDAGAKDAFNNQARANWNNTHKNRDL